MQHNDVYILPENDVWIFGNKSKELFAVSATEERFKYLKSPIEAPEPSVQCRSTKSVSLVGSSKLLNSAQLGSMVV